jgi:flagellum-specific ATP synthase
MQQNLNDLQESLRAICLDRPMGRIVSIRNDVIEISGLSAQASLGKTLTLKRGRNTVLDGEVIGIESEKIQMLPSRVPTDVAINDPVTLSETPEFRPCSGWIGRVIDPYGAPLDGLPLPGGSCARDLLASAPKASDRKKTGARLQTGLAVLNTILPIVEGQRIGLFSGSGVGKSRLISQLAKRMRADVVVVAMIGERGREVKEFVENVLGIEGMKRAVVVAATSDQSALVRRRCAWAAMAVAEHFRDEGANVLLLADSITRFAEAHRDIALAAGEVPALRGYPPSVTSLVTSLCERAGPGPVGSGDITAIFSVLVAGSDMDEPIADIMRGVLDGHVVLSRDIAERGRFPAIDVGQSVSRSLPEAASDEENDLIGDVRKYLGRYEQSQVMIGAGLYTEGADPVLDRAVTVWPELDLFFSRSESGSISDSFDKLAVLMRRTMPKGRA